MRPTRLNFRSPKGRTAEMNYPVCKHDGTKLDLGEFHINSNMRKTPIASQRFTTFSNERRFDYLKV